MQTLQSILVPLDGSPPSLAALEHAAVLAEDYGATIEALHVVADIDTATPVGDTGDAIEGAVRRAEAALGRSISLRSVVGDPIREIVEAARGVDLVVIGTHGFVGRLHALLGSVAEGVVRNAPCPVLTVHDTRSGYQSFAERRHHRPSVGEQAGG